MANLIKCKSCGYVTEEGKVTDVCPACGVPAKMFEPYVDPVSPQRRMILKLDIHPILVHFTVSFTFSLLILNLAAFFLKGDLFDDISTAARVIAFFLPITIILSFAGGLFDGKIRFRKVTTPLLKTKMLLSVIFFAISIVYFMLMLKFGFGGFLWLGIMAVVITAALGVVIALALIGTSLLEAKFPG
jgi:uncharacterized membrane protein